MRVLAGCVACGLALAGCGDGSGPLRVVGAQVPVGAEPFGKTGTKRGPGDPASGMPRFKLPVDNGQELSYVVSVRNAGRKAVDVVGVERDPDRDGAFVPERVEELPVRLIPRQEVALTVVGRVEGCRFGGQSVPLAGPKLLLGGADSQELGLPLAVELVTSRDGCTA